MHSFHITDASVLVLHLNLGKPNIKYSCMLHIFQVVLNVGNNVENMQHVCMKMVEDGTIGSLYFLYNLEVFGGRCMAIKKTNKPI